MPKLEPTGLTQKISLSQIKSTSNVRDTYSNIEELAQSIREHGLMQPIVVKRAESNSDGIQHYDLIAGHRRKKAFEYLCSQGEDFTMIDAIVKTGDKLALQLIENIQREDLNAEERESGIAQLADTGISQKEIAYKLSKTEDWISKQLGAYKIRQILKSKNIDTSKFETGILNIFRTLEEKELIPIIKSLKLIGISRSNAEKLMQEHRIETNLPTKKNSLLSTPLQEEKKQEKNLTKKNNEDLSPTSKKKKEVIEYFEVEDKQLSSKEVFCKINAYIIAIKDNIGKAESPEFEEAKINAAYDIIALLHGEK